MSYQNDPRLESLTHEIKKLETLISDHEWLGNFNYADDLREVLRDLYARREQGELYIPKF